MKEPTTESDALPGGAFPPIRPGWGALLFVALYAAAIYLPFLGSSRTLTRHEVMVTHPAQRMLAEGHWVVPRYASELWLDKPPLVNWLTAFSFVVFGGFSEFAARLPAALSAIGLCVLIALLTYRFCGRRAALFAGMVQATCVYMYMQGRLGEIDMPLAFLLTAAHAVLLWRWGRGQVDLPLGPAVLFHTLVGLAVLSKGAIAVAMVGMTVLAFCLFRRTWRPLRAVIFTPGLLCFVLIAGSWHVAAWMEARDVALEEWSYNSLLRFFGLHHLGAQPFYLYLYAVPMLLLPWTIILLINTRRLYREARRPDALLDHVLWAWFLGGFVFLNISLFKHKHYAIPILPPLSILCGRLLAEHFGRINVHAKRAWVVTFVVLPIIFGIVGGVIMPRRDHRRVTTDFVREATASVPAGNALYVVGLAQSSAYAYIEHSPCVYLDSLTDARAAAAKQAGHELWVLTLRGHEQLAEKEGLAFHEVRGEPEHKKHPRAETLVLATVKAPAAAAGE